MDIIVRSRTVEGVPLLELFRDDGEGKKPMILLYHGYLGRKEFILPQAYNLAANGFFVAVPDAYGHGERSGARIIDLFTAIAESTSEINMLIESYRDSENADFSRVGLSGYSMGGCITFLYLSMNDNKIKAAAPVISTPDWVSIAEGFNSPDKIKELMKLGIIEREDEIIEYIKAAGKIQPINRYEAMKDTPLLMLCGGSDTVTPAAGAEKLYQLLKPVIFDEEALRLVVYPGVGHGDTVEMNLELTEWMKRFVI